MRLTREPVSVTTRLQAGLTRNVFQGYEMQLLDGSRPHVIADCSSVRDDAQVEVECCVPRETFGRLQGGWILLVSVRTQSAYVRCLFHVKRNVGDGLTAVWRCLFRLLY